MQDLTFKLEHPLPFEYKGINLDCGYRIDLLIEEKLIIELKAVEEIRGIHDAQLLTYLKLSGISTGLLINFNVKLLENGIKRYIITSVLSVLSVVKKGIAKRQKMKHETHIKALNQSPNLRAFIHNELIAKNSTELRSRLELKSSRTIEAGEVHAWGVRSTIESFSHFSSVTAKGL